MHIKLTNTAMKWPLQVAMPKTTRINTHTHNARTHTPHYFTFYLLTYNHLEQGRLRRERQADTVKLFMYVCVLTDTQTQSL